MPQDLLLGLDVGTHAVKAAVFDRSGALIDHSVEKYPTLSEQPGFAEQRPTDWWLAICRAVAAISARGAVDKSRIVGISLCAQMCGIVPVDKWGEPLRDCLIWVDTRSTATARKVAGGHLRIRGYGPVKLVQWLRLANGAPNLDGRDTFSKIRWIMDHEPEVGRAVHKFLDVKDYLIFRLSGRYTTTVDCAHLTWLFDSRPHRRCWSPRLMAMAGIDDTLLPEICEMTELAGQLRPEAANDLGLQPGISIGVGCGDVVASAIGAGAMMPKTMCLNLGTGSFLGLHSAARRFHPSGIGTIAAARPGHNLLVAAQECAGACVDWAVKMLGLGATGTNGYQEFDNLAQNSPAGARGVRFLPWMYGERVPIQDNEVRGGFVNLEIWHRQEDLARAVLEGVALNIRWAFSYMEKMGVDSEGAIRLAGGGASSMIWRQIIADVLNQPVAEVPQPALSGTQGVAMTLGVAMGWYPSLESALVSTNSSGVTYPEALHADMYSAMFREFVNYYRRSAYRRD